MLDHLGGGDRAELQRALELEPARLAQQEAGSEQVAGAGRVDQLVDRLGGNVGALASARRQCAVLAPGDDEGFNTFRHCGDRVSRCGTPASASTSAWLAKRISMRRASSS